LKRFKLFELFLGILHTYIERLTRAAWRMCMVAIVSVTGTENLGFESRQGVWFLGVYTLQFSLSRIF
jgi:hypothetical protein